MATDDIGRVLVTAASGAVARHLIARLDSNGVAITAAARGAIVDLPPSVRIVSVGRIDARTDWSDALSGVSHIVHAAALTKLQAGETEADFDAVNHHGTRALAEQAVAAKVHRFVQISTAAVNGRASATPIAPDGPTAPTNAYARSKLAGEMALWSIAACSDLEVAVVRPPRIVWPRLTGNLRLFERLIAKGVPLPLGAIASNMRDNVSPDNLVAIIQACLIHPAAPGNVFFATDGDPLSTRALAERIGKRLARRARLVSVPAPLLRAVVAMMPARFLGGLTRREMVSELLDDFHLDIGPTCDRLEWQPVRGTL